KCRQGRRGATTFRSRTTPMGNRDRDDALRLPRHRQLRSPAQYCREPTIDEGASVPERLMLFSFDGHVGEPPELDLEHIEPRYRGALEALREENDEWVGYTKFYGFERGERYGVFDAGRLLEELDAEGIAGQVLLNGHGMATTPFFSVANDPYPPEL